MVRLCHVLVFQLIFTGCFHLKEEEEQPPRRQNKTEMPKSQQGVKGKRTYQTIL